MRTAIILFNLGGPSSLADVEPFLFNLFSDPAIIRLPNPLRWFVAKLISKRRAPIAREIYTKLGGSSPILGQTYSQASALQHALAGASSHCEVFVAMRYSSPRATDTIEQVRRYRPTKIVLLPLYPQYSTTTSRSSIKEWTELAKEKKLSAPTATICCYPSQSLVVEAYADLIRQSLGDLPPNLKYRILFSAHGLPERIAKSGDPYQEQVEATSSAIAAALHLPALDWKTTYQSRVGPMKWIGPSTDDEIRKAGSEGKALIVVPVAFVSEHSETLVELDIEYAQLAHESGIPVYKRVPALGTHPAFINGLADLVKANLATTGVTSAATSRICSSKCGKCPMTLSSK